MSQLAMATASRLRIVAAVPLQQHLSTSSKPSAGNDYNYYEAYKNFTWNVPEGFNFAQDVIDKHATGELKDRTALLLVGEDDTEETKLSYSELSRRSKEVAVSLNSLGKISRAVTVLPKVPEWWLLNVAALRTGTVLLPGTTLLTADDIAARIHKSESDCVIGDADVATKVEAESHGKHLRHKILVTTTGNEQLEADFVNRHGWVPLNDLVAQNASLVGSLEPRSGKNSDLMQIFFTSGTTGAPKMVPQTMEYARWLSVVGKYWLDLTPDDLHWNIADTGWAKSAWSSVFAPWTQGAGVFVHGMRRFTSSEVFKVLSERPITTLCAPPTLYRGMVKEWSSGAEECTFPGLRHCVSGGEPLNEEVISTWRRRTGIDIKEGYGQTETVLVAGTFKGMEMRPGSMGKPAPGMDVQVVDDGGEEVRRGQEGNLGILCRPNKTHGLFAGYLTEGGSIANYKTAGNFYLTGDRATMDEDGYIWFTSRDDDVIISSGYRIGPFEVESVLLEHPSVAESAVVASPDDLRGQIVKAFIVPTSQYAEQVRREGDRETLIGELQDFVKGRTAPYKYPRVIEFVDSLPKTVSGKIMRNVLRKREISEQGG